MLLVEDSVADHKLVQLALEEAGSRTRLHHVEDGAEAIAVLDAVSTGGRPRPDLVVLDLNLPRVSGVDVLRRVKSDPVLRTIPVVVSARRTPTSTCRWPTRAAPTRTS